MLRRLGNRPVRTALVLGGVAVRDLLVPRPRPPQFSTIGYDIRMGARDRSNGLPATRLGLHVTAEELDIWRDRAERGPYRVAGDAIANSPGDWERISEHASIFKSQPRAGRWRGPLYKLDECIVQSPRWPRDLVGMPPRLGPPEQLRDAAFHAMVAEPANRDAIVELIKRELLWHTDQPGLDFSNEKRFCLKRFGPGYHPGFQISAWLRKLAYGFDYSRIAAPTIWSAGEEKQFLDWLASATPWYMAQIDAHREGMWNADGTLTARAERIGSRAARPIWMGGPITRRVQHRYNNHVNRFAVLVTDIGILTGQDDRKYYGRRWIEEFLKVCVYPSGAIGDFYRWDDEDKGHLQGWKYGMEMLGATLIIADHLARAGDASGYEFGTTKGTRDTAGPVPDDGLTNGGPKTLYTTVRQLLRYIDEHSEPVRYASWGSTDPRRRITSRDEITHTFRADEWLTLQGNVFYQDAYARDVYMRALPGTPELPSEPRHGLGWIFSGDLGTFPGVNFMFAQMEGKVWPYSL